MPLTENLIRLTATGACLSNVSVYVLTGPKKLWNVCRVYICDQKLQWFQSEDNEVPAKEKKWPGFEQEPPIQYFRFWFEYALWFKKFPGFNPENLLGQRSEPGFGFVISLFFHLILIFSLHCQLFLLISGYYTTCNIKITYQCKMIIVPEDGWFGQPKYSTPTKKILLRCVDFCFYFLHLAKDTLFSSPLRF